MEKTWLKQYPAGVPAEIDVDQYPSLVALLDESFTKYATARPTSSWARRSPSAQVDDASRALRRLAAGAGPRQGRPRRGDAAQRAAVPGRGRRRSCAPGSWWSTSTRCTRRASSSTSSRTRAPRRSSSSRTSPARCSRCMPAVPTKTVVLAAMGDMLGFPKGAIVNYVVRKVKKMVPAFDLPGAVRFNDALAPGRGKPLQAGAGRPRRHRGAAVHRRHHRRQQGRGAAASQPGRQHPAVRGLVPAGAEEDPDRRAGRHRSARCRSITSSASTRT